ncbi:pilus assembly protein TadG-related protein [Kribbella sp. WER1]
MTCPDNRRRRAARGGGLRCGAKRSERGSATLQVLFCGVLLFAVFAAVILWSAISTARHKVSAAADLAALSAAQVLTTPSVGDARRGSYLLSSSGRAGAVAPGSEACRVAGRVAGGNGARLVGCEVVGGVVSVQVSVEVDLRVGRVTLVGWARAGPV